MKKKFMERREGLKTSRLFLCLMISCLLASGFAHSQQQGDHQSSEKSHVIGLSVGQYFLNGDFADFGDNGISPSFRYTYMSGDVFHLNLGLYLADLDGARDFQMNAFTIGVKNNLVYYDNLVPFFEGGLGFYKPQVNVGGEKVSKTAFGIYGGVGADLLLNESFEVGAAFLYHNPFKVDASYGNGSNFEFSGSFFTLMIRGGFRF